MPSLSCSSRRCSGGPVPAQVSKVGTCLAMSSLFTRTLRVTPMVLGSPPSTTTASDPLGILTRLGARSRMDAVTRPRQMSGFRSIWPSADMTLYSRAMTGSFQWPVPWRTRTGRGSRSSALSPAGATGGRPARPKHRLLTGQLSNGPRSCQCTPGGRGSSTRQSILLNSPWAGTILGKDTGSS